MYQNGVLFAGNIFFEPKEDIYQNKVVI